MRTPQKATKAKGMKIALFTDTYKPQINGVVTQIENTATALAEMGNEILIVAPATGLKFEVKEEKRATAPRSKGKRGGGSAGGTTVVCLPSIALPTYKDYRITDLRSGRLNSELKKFKPEVVHVQTPFGIGVLGRRYGKRHRVPVIGTYHTHIPEFLMYLPLPLIRKTAPAKHLAWAYVRRFYNKCDIVTVPSNTMKRELEKKGIKHVRVLANAIDFKRFNKFAKKKYALARKGRTNKFAKKKYALSRTGKAKMIYFGRIGYEKNIEFLLFALRELRARGVDAELTITGSGPALEKIKKTAHAEGLGKNVVFNAPMKSDALAKHVAGHDFFVTASTIETQGLTIMESMATGLPCIGADCLAIPDSIKDGVNGFLFKPFDHAELADKMEKLIHSEALREKMGKAALKTARAFTIEKIAKETEALYKGALRRGNRAEEGHGANVVHKRNV
ncbi:MAG: glycosyltransferase [Candidatus Diapherotrites archaeon]